MWTIRYQGRMSPTSDVREPHRRRRARSSPRPLRRLRGAAVLGVLVLLAACAGTNGSGSSSGSGAGSKPLPGITAGTVKVGYTIVDTGALESQLGFHNAEQGGVTGLTKVIDALVAYVNAHGGMGGRQVSADIESYQATTDSPEQTTALCSSFTQDNRVFAAVLDGALQNNALPCYRAANTLIVDETAIAHDTAQFQQYSPYLWSPTHPEYGAFIRAQLQVLQQAGFFAGNTGVQLIPDDSEVPRRVTTSIVTPTLQSYGVTKVGVNYIDGTTIGSLGQTSSAAMASGKQLGYNRVIVVGGARILGVALADQNASTYNSTWSISSWDLPYFMQTNTATEEPARLTGMVGLGYAPTYDVGPDAGIPFPDPARPAEGVCKSIVDAAGATPGPGQRPNYQKAFQYCDATFFLKDTLDRAAHGATLTAQQFGAAVAQIGSAYSSAVGFASSYGPNQYAATTAARELVFESSCRCFQYHGANIPLGSATSAAPLPTITVP